MRIQDGVRSQSGLIILGIAVGFFLGSLALIIAMFYSNAEISFAGLLGVHIAFPVLFITDSLIIVFPLLFYLAGKSSAIREKELKMIIENQTGKSVKVLEYIKTIGKQDAENLRFDEEDEIDRALVSLHTELLRTKKEDEQRKLEEAQRNWATGGMARFAEILRNNNDNLENLAYQVISNLVKYLEANQGGFFLINDEIPEDIHFSLLACYAYDRRKFADKRLEWGEGLVGMCAIERESVYMTDVPHDYLDITSGLGGSNPRCVFMAPLQINEEVHGVIELASFSEFAEYQREFVMKVAESIASTIGSVKINIKTARLLKESQEKSEMLVSQEEEMRQNLEELQATQEEVLRQGKEMRRFSNTMNHTLIRAEYSREGILQYANMNFIEILSYDGNSEVEGSHFSKFFDEKDMPKIDSIWDELVQGGKHYKGDMKHVSKFGRDVWIMSTYACIRDEDGVVVSISFIGIDITARRMKDLDYESQIEALNESMIKAEFLPSGAFNSCNNLFKTHFRYSDEELKDKTVYDIINLDSEYFKNIWKAALKSIPYKGQLKTTDGEGRTRWFQVNISAAINLYGELEKVIFLANETTEQKEMEEETRRQSEELRKQEQELKMKIEQLKLIQDQMQENQKKLTESENLLRVQVEKVEAEKQKSAEILEGCVEAIITFDKNGIIDLYNRAAEDLWAISKDEATGSHIELLFPCDIVEEEEGISVYYKDEEKRRLNNSKVEINIINSSEEEVSVLITLLEIVVNGEVTFTAFVQNIEVELF